MKKARNSSTSGRTGSSSKPAASKAPSRTAASRGTATKSTGSRPAAKGTKSTGTASRSSAATGKGRAGAPTTRTTGAASRSTGTGRGNSKATAPATKKTATKNTATKNTATRNTATNKTASKKTATKSVASRSNNTKQAAPARSRAKQQSPKEGLEKVFKDCLKDIYYAEKRLSSALKKMAKASSNTDLVDAFTIHKDETDGQIEMLNRAFESIGMRAQSKKCEAMDGLLKEADEHIEEFEKGPARDAALIVGAQKVEHYEIAAYGSLKTFASMLGYNDCQEIFEEIEGQEKNADSKLTMVARAVNQEALQEDGDMNSGSTIGGGNNSGANTSDNDDLNDADFDDDDDDDDDLSELGDGDEGADADGADD